MQQRQFWAVLWHFKQKEEEPTSIMFSFLISRLVYMFGMSCYRLMSKKGLSAHTRAKILRRGLWAHDIRVERRVQAHLCDLLACFPLCQQCVDVNLLLLNKLRFPSDLQNV